MSLSSMTPVATPDGGVVNDKVIVQPPWESHWTRVCKHDFVARLKRYGSTTRARMQCKKCGAGGTMVATRGVFEMWDAALEQRCQSEYQSALDEWHDRRQAAFNAAARDRADKWWSLYSDYLRSAVWRKKRQLVMERNVRLNRGLCEACGEIPPSDVHHTKYPKTFGHEPLWDLQAVCRKCHQIFHPHMKED